MRLSARENHVASTWPYDANGRASRSTTRDTVDCDDHRSAFLWLLAALRAHPDMHRCLLIHEIAQLVAAHLNDAQDDDESTWAPARQDLAHLALACRALYEPAINELWSRLEGLKPLVQCLPPDAVREHDEGSYWSYAIVRYF